MNWFNKKVVESQTKNDSENSAFHDRDMSQFHGDVGQFFNNYSNENDFEIRTNFLPLIQKKVEVLQRKAEKLGVTPIQILVSAPYIKMIVTETKFNGEVKKSPFEFVKVTLTGEPPKLAGWEFVARVDYMENGVVAAVSPAPSFEGTIPAIYWKNGPECDQCHSHRYRKNTYIVRNIEAGEFKQVGGECLKDFLGHPNPRQYAGYLDNLIALFNEAEEMSGDEDERSGRRKVELFPVREILLRAHSLIRVLGYKSSSENLSTKALTFMFLNPYRNKDQQEFVDELRAKGCEVNDVDKQKTDELIEWGKTIPEDTPDNYLRNIKNLLQFEFAKLEHIGYLASAFLAKKRQDENWEKKEKKEKKESGFVGSIGQKILVYVTFDTKRSIETMYGRSTMYIFKDGSGNKYTMFSTSESLTEILEGEEIILFATIKEHYINKVSQMKSTTLVRGKPVPYDLKAVEKAKKASDLVLLPPDISAIVAQKQQEEQKKQEEQKRQEEQNKIDIENHRW